MIIKDADGYEEYIRDIISKLINET